ncbi:hypothetical protein [Salipaludibacillus daqingensis]|uniref:hypothetical protein n=1 Tax=Salipaludibacillus daqingensis TaxID=3041001 RepID=UPI002473E5E4|nr:hypothetical protein [Salipaludibacillus daqingensis]
MKHRFLVGLASLSVFIIALSIYRMQKDDIPMVSTWIWNTEKIQSSENREEMKEYLIINDIKIVYLQANETVGYESYQSFIEGLAEYGIEVHALDGAPIWGEEEHQTFLDWFNDYQKQAGETEKFTGIHLDLEPYIREDWDERRDEIVLDYQTSIHVMAQEASNLGISFGIDIPFWFDEIDFDNSFGSGTLAKWLMQEVDDITIMAYRNQAEGENGIIKLVEQEIQWGTDFDKNIVIAVETIELPESHTSFYGKNKSEMNEQLVLVNQKYKDDPSFKGFAVHHLESWMAMGEEQ